MNDRPDLWLAAFAIVVLLARAEMAWGGVKPKPPIGQGGRR